MTDKTPMVIKVSMLHESSWYFGPGTREELTRLLIAKGFNDLGSDVWRRMQGRKYQTATLLPLIDPESFS